MFFLLIKLVVDLKKCIGIKESVYKKNSLVFKGLNWFINMVVVFIVKGY